MPMRSFTRVERTVAVGMAVTSHHTGYGILTLDVTPLGVWRRSERPDRHAQHEEWVTSGRRWDPASSRLAAVDCAGTVSCTRGGPPDADPSPGPRYESSNDSRMAMVPSV